MVDPTKTISSLTAHDIWALAIEYFKWSDSNPIKIKKSISSGKGAGTHYYDEQPRPYSLKAFCVHSGLIEDYLADIRRTKREDSDYYIVVSKIMYIIYIQNSDLAQVGVYSPIFTSKLLGLDAEPERPDKPITVQVVQGLPSLSRSENEVLKSIEMEKPFFKNEEEE